MVVVACKRRTPQSVLVLETGIPTIVHVKTNILAVVGVHAILTTMVTTIFAYATAILMETVASVVKNIGGGAIANCTATGTVRTSYHKGQLTVMVMASVKYKRATMSKR